MNGRAQGTWGDGLRVIICGMAFALVITSATLLSSIAAQQDAEPPPLKAPATQPRELTTALPYADGIRIIDGDTIEADVVLPWGVTLREQNIRAAGFDAWETSRRRKSVNLVPDEVERGKRAEAALAALLETGRLYLLPDTNEPRDAYGRILARWQIDRDGELVDVADIMRAAGHERGEQ